MKLVVLFFIKRLEPLSPDTIVLTEPIIGMRYAYQTLKIAIVHTIRNFRLLKCSETTAEDGLNFSIRNNGFRGGIKFKVEALERNN